MHAGQGKCWINVSSLKSSEAAEKCHEQKDRTKVSAFFQLRGTHAGRKVPKGLASDCLLQLTWLKPHPSDQDCAPTAKGHTDCQSLQLPSQAQEVLTLWFQRQKHYGFLRFFFLATFGFLIHSVIKLSVLQGQHKENTVFLRSNSHTIKFTNVKYIAQEFLVYSQSCGTITII